MKSNTTKQPLVENSEIQYLQNAADDLGLIVHEKFNQDKRQTIKKYFAQKGNETVSPVLDYEQLNHFLLGYRKAVNERKALLDSHRELLDALEDWQNWYTNAESGLIGAMPIYEKAKTMILKYKK